MIMPQKRNPKPLDLSRQITRFSIGQVLTVLLLTFIILFAIGQATGYLFDSPAARSQRWADYEQKCGGQVYIVINPSLDPVASEYVGPDNPRYAEARQKALTPHQWVKLACRWEAVDAPTS
jgi:hypothetical protein